MRGGRAHFAPEGSILLSFSPERLAETLAVSPSQIRRYETGQSVIPAARLVQAAEVLGVAEQWFFKAPKAHEPLAELIRLHLALEQAPRGYLLDAARALLKERSGDAGELGI